MRIVVEKLDKHLKHLKSRGPHRVLTGELDYSGLPGKVYTPAKGSNLPAIAFGHDWMTDIKRYHSFLRHLASWGIVVVAPNTETALNPDHTGFAEDLGTALEIASGIRLGNGNITVSRQRRGLMGHGMGAGAAILAASQTQDIAGVVAAYPSKVSPSAEQAAQLIGVPGLVLGSHEYSGLDYGNAAAVALHWTGPCVYRDVKKADHTTLSRTVTTSLLTGGGLRFRAGRGLLWALTTGFILGAIAGEKKYTAFAERTATAKGVTMVAGNDLAERAGLIDSADSELS